MISTIHCIKAAEAIAPPSQSQSLSLLEALAVHRYQPNMEPSHRSFQSRFQHDPFSWMQPRQIGHASSLRQILVATLQLVEVYINNVEFYDDDNEGFDHNDVYGDDSDYNTNNNYSVYLRVYRGTSFGTGRMNQYYPYDPAQ